MRSFRNTHQLAALAGISALAPGLATSCDGNDDTAGHETGGGVRRHNGALEMAAD